MLPGVFVIPTPGHTTATSPWWSGEPTASSCSLARRTTQPPSSVPTRWRSGRSATGTVVPLPVGPAWMERLLAFDPRAVYFAHDQGRLDAVAGVVGRLLRCARLYPMSDRVSGGRVLQMRLVVEAVDYDEAVAFYRDVLGAPEELMVENCGRRKGDHPRRGPGDPRTIEPGAGRDDRRHQGRAAGRAAPAGGVRGGRRGRGDRRVGRRRRRIGCPADPHAVGLAERAAQCPRRPSDHPLRRA